MDYESLKEEFIRVKKEELNYINTAFVADNISTLTEEQRLIVYRKLNIFHKRLDTLIRKIEKEVFRNHYAKYKRRDIPYFEFDIDEKFLSTIEINNYTKRLLLSSLWINPDTMKFEFRNRFGGYIEVSPSLIANGLFQKQFYLFTGIDYDLDPFFGNEVNRHGVYINMFHFSDIPDEIE